MGSTALTDFVMDRGLLEGDETPHERCEIESKATDGEMSVIIGHDVLAQRRKIKLRFRGLRIDAFYPQQIIKNTQLFIMHSIMLLKFFCNFLVDAVKTFSKSAIATGFGSREERTLFSRERPIPSETLKQIPVEVLDDGM